MVRKWISFRELYDDPEEREDLGISLVKPLHVKIDELETIEFNITPEVI